MTKELLIEQLEASALLLELQGENPFKCRAYLNAARAIAEMETDLNEAIKDRSLLERKGIGKAMFEKISEAAATGRLGAYDELKATTPPGLLEMLKIKGLGTKRVRTIYEKLGIKDLVDLEYACIENRLADLTGFGKKIQEKTLQEIASLKKRIGFYHVHVARRAGEALLEKVKGNPSVIRAALGGSLRRRNEIVQDIDLIVSGDSPSELISFFCALPEVEREVARSEERARVTLKSGIQADLHATTDDRFPHVLHHCTGSKEYHAALEERAKRYGIRISEYGLFLEDHILPCQEEKEIFSTLELDYIEPELRENRGEIEAAARRLLPPLIEEKDIRGIFHVHSTYSDGSASLSDMIEAAERAGLEYIGISDHSETASYANGLKEDRIQQQHEEIERLRGRFKKIHIFKGIEADILPDGRIDYDDRVLSSFDFVIASVHSRFNMSEREMTDRVVRAMSHPKVTFLGHPTGRILLSRQGYPLALPEVIDAARRHGVIIELNASPYRLDLDWRQCRPVKEAGVRLSINPDAHGIEGINDMTFGVGIARKGWLSKEDVINTLPLDQIQSYLMNRKK
ncbi:MAG: DNA polymerase/3'-5' exonuclease PolX [Nitrospirae bacterium]|nr:DNA polymerase/3'-5' exonuclease PolX [Candidatus Manganitrophaceae bacterium]